MFKKLLALTLTVVMIAALCVSFASCSLSSKKGEGEEILPRKEITSSVEVPADFKIGLITLHDENSTYDKNFIDAFRQVCVAMGISEDNFIIKSNIPEGVECYDTAKDLANRGCKVVFADSFGHEQYMAQAAAEFPNVQFCHATGVTAKTTAATLPNFHNAFAAIYEGRYLAGIVAGMKLNEMIESGKIKAEEAVMGYVGAFTYAEVISGLSSFYLGAKSVCPSVTMKVRFTGSWYDQGLEQEAANSLITDKCVLISQHADSLGAPTACQQAKVPNVSYNGSTYNAGKDTWLVSSAINWAPYFQYIIEKTVKGEAFDTDWTGTIATNSVVLSGLNLDVIADGTEEKVQEALNGFKNGTLHVYDTSKFTVKVTTDNVTVSGVTLTSLNCPYVHDGYFDESNAETFMSAPYFSYEIDGIEFLNSKY